MKTKSGFTIVELIIAITVIAILAAITVVSYNGAKARADASAAAEAFTSIDKAFHLYGVDKQWTAWPCENCFGGAGINPSVQTIIDYSPNSYLKSLMPDAPKTVLFPASAWYYDYDMDVASSNCNFESYGVNLAVNNVTSAQASAIDKAIDDNNTNCGKVRWDPVTNSIYYKLSSDGSFYP